MTATPNLFADRLTNITVANGLVRFEFASLETPVAPTQGAETATPPTMAVTHRLTLPLDGFLNAFNIQQGILKSLIDSGIVKTGPATSPQDAPAN